MATGEPSTCTGTNFGLNVQQSRPGLLSGYVWSSNVGWISFEPAAVSGCSAPTNDEGCQAFADWSATSRGVTPVKGWARVCSVFASGCSGPLKSSAKLGGWDGFIKLGDNTSSSEGWGVKITNNALNGYGWGSDVIGWVEFKGNIGSLGADMCPNEGEFPGIQLVVPGGYIVDINGKCVKDPGCPTGYVVDTNGSCVVDPGTTAACPAGYVLNTKGECVLDPGCQTKGCNPPKCEKGDPCWCEKYPDDKSCDTPSGPTCEPTKQVSINGICIECLAPNVVVINDGKPQCVAKCPAGQVANLARVCVKPGIKEF